MFLSHFPAIGNNIWSTLDVEPTGLNNRQSNLIVYQNLLLVNGGTKKGLSMALLDLDRMFFSVILEYNE